ncbi:2'-5' RNA ligase family protein [Piscinibacter koreensis]|uniref:2'-5' RNA ligase family protein n=1 Tax=Piscinibacter koreensis TaxID=2742824 RepID=A0A7Y6NNX6_9BURK|nr:2'-5' RNA ligase family protein [Schlegelella koreensis]
MSAPPDLARDAPPRPLIVTLRLGEPAAAQFSALRRAHFPAHRNWLDAHVTLFHALPGAAIDRVLADAAEVARSRSALTLRVERVLFLGAGVAYAPASPQADGLRAELARRWTDLLGRQDRAKRGPLHITVQNKVAPNVARALHAELVRHFEPTDISATGLEVWHYEDGPWRAAADYPFSGPGTG